MNLNTHRAYKAFRQRRAELQGGNERMSGLVLVETLPSYSERGAEYVKSLKSIINVNRLDPADDTYLSDDPPIYLVPVQGEPE
jgi:Bax protein